MQIAGTPRVPLCAEVLQFRDTALGLVDQLNYVQCDI